MGHDAEDREAPPGGPLSTMVRGAMAGAVGTWAMDRADWFMWDQVPEEARRRTVAVRPHGEPPAHVMARQIEDKVGAEPDAEDHAAAGQAIHFGIGVAPAVAYACARHHLPGRGVVRGLMFGTGMFLIQDELMNTASGLGAKPRDYPWQAHGRGLVAHLVFGVVTELTLNAMESSARRMARDYAEEPG